MNINSIPIDIPFDNIIQNDNQNKYLIHNINNNELMGKIIIDTESNNINNNISNNNHINSNNNGNTFRETQQNILDQRVDNIENFQNFMKINSSINNNNSNNNSNNKLLEKVLTKNNSNNILQEESNNNEDNMNIINAKNDYDSFIIKPPPTRDIFKDKTVNLFIDSRDRNTIENPTSSKFKVGLQQEYRTIKAIELELSQIPASQYIVNNNNNQLYFIIGNQEITEITEIETIKIKTGNYQKDELAIDSILYSNLHLGKIQLKKDSLAKQIEKQLRHKITQISSNKCNNIPISQITKPIIEVEFNDIKETYIFNSDLCPINSPNKTYQGELLQLCFEGNKHPYGTQEIEKIPKRNAFQTIERDEEGNIIYQEIKVGDDTIKYKKNSIGSIIGFDIKNYNGYIINNITNTKTNDLTLFTIKELNITNQEFTDNLIEEQYILIKQKEKIQRFKIKEIIDGYTFRIYDTNDISLVGDNSPLIPPPYSNIIPILSFDNAELYSGRIIPPFVRNFEKDKYVIMKIKMCHRIDGHESSTQNSFAIIPFNNSFAYDVKPNDFSNTRFYRSFNPPIPRLNELEFEFLNYDGSRYDFNGKDINMLFNIQTLNQPNKYGN